MQIRPFEIPFLGVQNRSLLAQEIRRTQCAMAIFMLKKSAKLRAHCMRFGATGPKNVIKKKGIAIFGHRKSRYQCAVDQNTPKNGQKAGKNRENGKMFAIFGHRKTRYQCARRNSAKFDKIRQNSGKFGDGAAFTASI